MRFSGMPQSPKPPIRTVMPSFRLAMAASVEEMRLSMCKSLQCRNAAGERCVCSVLMGPQEPQRIAHQFQDGLGFGVEGVFAFAFDVDGADDFLFPRIKDRDNNFGPSGAESGEITRICSHIPDVYGSAKRNCGSCQPLRQRENRI